MDYTTMFRVYKNFRELILNFEFIKDPYYRKNVLLDSEVELKLINNDIVKKNPSIIVKQYPLEEEVFCIPPELNSIIIDFEGDPIKLMGILCNNIIYSYLLSDEAHTVSFYKLIIKIIRSFSRSLFFGFTFWDYEQIFAIRDKLEFHEEYHFLTKIKYFDLQERDRESVAEALYSIGVQLPRDPLYRRNYRINQLYEDGFNEIIRQHNISCLKAESRILQRRYLPKTLFLSRIPSQITKFQSEIPR